MGAILLGAWVLQAGIGSNARTALDAARALVRQGKPPADPAVQALAARTLRRDATLPAAIELRALADEHRGDRSAAARLYRLSDRISRRSLATRLWLVQDAVDRGDALKALAQMGIALRTSSAAPAIVFPALARGLEDPQLVKPIATLADRPSEWREAFLVYAADNADPGAAAALLLTLPNRQVVSADELDRVVIVRLVEEGQFALARRVERTFGRRSRKQPLLADPDFSDGAARYPFGWGLTERGELGASRETDHGRAALAYHANLAESGQVAAQLLTLPAGQYRLKSRTGRPDEAEAQPRWVLSCAAPPRPIVTLALSAQLHGQSSIPFSIRPDCPAQWLVLTIRPAMLAQKGSVEAVTITPE